MTEAIVHFSIKLDREVSGFRSDRHFDLSVCVECFIARLFWCLMIQSDNFYNTFKKATQ